MSTLLGGIAATMAILAITDAVTGREALSTDVSVLLQDVLARVGKAVQQLKREPGRDCSWAA